MKPQTIRIQSTHDPGPSGIPTAGIIVGIIAVFAAVYLVNQILAIKTMLTNMDTAEDPLELLGDIGAFGTVGSLSLLGCLIAFIVILICIPVSVSLIMKRK
jgi:hypothetical protein